MSEQVPKQAMIIGFDKLQTYLDKQIKQFKTIKIANAYNSKTDFRKEFNQANSSDNVAALFDYLTEFSPGGVHYAWWIGLYKDKDRVEYFSFSAFPVAVSVGVGGLDPDFVNRLVEAEKKNAVLEYQMNQIAQEALEDEDEDDEDDYIGAIKQQLITQILPEVAPMIPKLIAGIINSLNLQKPQPLQVSGIEDPASFLQVLFDNGLTMDHLKIFADMAVNDKAKFRMLLMML